MLQRCRILLLLVRYRKLNCIWNKKCVQFNSCLLMFHLKFFSLLLIEFVCRTSGSFATAIFCFAEVNRFLETIKHFVIVNVVFVIWNPGFSSIQFIHVIEVPSLRSIYLNIFKISLQYNFYSLQIFSLTCHVENQTFFPIMYYFLFMFLFFFDCKFEITCGSFFIDNIVFIFADTLKLSSSLCGIPFRSSFNIYVYQQPRTGKKDEKRT